MTELLTKELLPWLRRCLSRFLLGPIVPILIRSRLAPNHLTLLGLAIVGVAAALVATDHLLTAGILVLVGGVFDMFDGALARATGKSSIKGAFLDSNLDRVGELAILLGILVYTMQRDLAHETFLLFLALGGSLMVSYVKARAEGLGLKCDAGYFTRPERVLLVAVALLMGHLLVPLYLLAILSLLTVVHRFVHVWTRSEESRT